MASSIAPADGAALMSQQVGITQQSLAAVIAQRNALQAVQRQLA